MGASSIPGSIFIPRFTDKELRFLECIVQGFPITPILPDTSSLRPRIDNLSPTNACPNQQVTINGSWFHPQCRVRFSGGNGTFINAQILSRSLSKLVVRMPPNAVAGSVDIVNPGPGFMRCGYFVPTYIFSNKKDIDGGLTIIHSLRLLKNGQAIAYAEPGEDVQVHWNVSPHNASIKLTILHWNNGVVATQNNLDAAGSFNFSIPGSINVERTYKVKLEVNGSCGNRTEELDIPISIKPTLKIEAVEVTQGIQNFSIANDGPNNVDLISKKGTIVRVFVSSNRSGFNNDQVNLTGKIVMGNQRLYPINGATNTQVVTSGVNPSSITALPKSQLQRTETDHSLNFFIPCFLARGNKTFEISVWSINENVWEATAQRTMTFQWIPEQRLKVRWFRIRMTNHGNHFLTTNQAEYNFTRAIDLLPSTTLDLYSAPISAYVSGLDLNDYTDKGVFMKIINNTRKGLINNHGLESSALFAGVIGRTTGIGLGRANRPGKNSWSQVHENTDGENSGRRVTTAHELAHNLGFSHVGSQTDGNDTPGQQNPNAGDINHPNDGFIEDEDIAFDCFYNTTIKVRCYTNSGNTICGVGDFMSYFRPRRPSVHQWKRLVSEI